MANFDGFFPYNSTAYVNMDLNDIFSPDYSPEMHTREVYDENTGVYWQPIHTNTLETSIDPRLLTTSDTSVDPLDPAFVSYLANENMQADIDRALMEENFLHHHPGMDVNANLELGDYPNDQSMSDSDLDAPIDFDDALPAEAEHQEPTEPSLPPTIYPSPFDESAESSLYNPAHTKYLLAPPKRTPNRYPDTVVRGPPPPLIPAPNGRDFVKAGKKTYYQPLPDIPDYISGGFTAELTEEARQRIEARTLERQMEKRRKAQNSRKPGPAKRNQAPVAKPRRVVRKPSPVVKREDSSDDSNSEPSDLSNVFSESDNGVKKESESEYERPKSRGRKGKKNTRKTVSGRVRKSKRVVGKAKLPKGLEIDMKRW
ncbi:MAG: hypothetical protein LQ350_002286 [Teloschistes chrysophthalmus]|nr:MAG: hypothetical protein LQ350_002286 [Niorma chrysophthalma]